MADAEQSPSGEAMPALEAAADEAIATCGGSPREAVKALLILNEALEAELAETRLVASYGYTRGYHRNRQRPAENAA